MASASDSAGAGDQSTDNSYDDDINTTGLVNQDEDDTLDQEGAGDNTNDRREQGTAHGNTRSQPTDLVCEPHSLYEM